MSKKRRKKGKIQLGETWDKTRTLPNEIPDVFCPGVHLHQWHEHIFRQNVWNSHFEAHLPSATSNNHWVRDSCLFPSAGFNDPVHEFLSFLSESPNTTLKTWVNIPEADYLLCKDTLSALSLSLATFYSYSLVLVHWMWWTGVLHYCYLLASYFFTLQPYIPFKMRSHSFYNPSPSTLLPMLAVLLYVFCTSTLSALRYRCKNSR